MSVILSAFIDNIPYTATMLTVIPVIAVNLGIDPKIMYYGLLCGATLGGNLTRSEHPRTSRASAFSARRVTR